MKKHIFSTGCCLLLLLSFGLGSFSATPLHEIGAGVQFVESDTEPPTIEIVTPVEGYFHFSGIKLFPTVLNVVADTMGFGGFRVRPVQVKVTDNVDASEDIGVYMYVYDDKQGSMTWNEARQLHERKWIGPDLGVFTLNISAQDTSGNSAYKEMTVWYFCFIPE